MSDLRDASYRKRPFKADIARQNMATNRSGNNGRASSSTYLSDVDYVSRYNPLLNPSNHRYISVLKGWATGALETDFRYLDQGAVMARR